MRAWISSDELSVAMLSAAGSFFFSIWGKAANSEESTYSRSSYTTAYDRFPVTNLAQHAKSHVDGRQQSPERRSHFGVKGRSGEAEHEQGSVLGQVHTLHPGHRGTWPFSFSRLAQEEFVCEQRVRPGPGESGSSLE